MKHRYCDFCKKVIFGDYHKVTTVKHENKKQILTHSADMCNDCYNEYRVKEK